MESLLRAIDPFDEFRDAPLVCEGFFPAGESIAQLDGRPLVEERQLAEPVFQRIVIELGVLEDLGVRMKGDLGAGAISRTGAELLDVGHGDAALIFLDKDLAAAADLGFGPVGKRRDRLGPHAVQAGGGFVGALVELGPGTHGREHDFQRRPAHLGMNVNRDAAAIVGDAQAAVIVDLHMDVVAKTGERFIDAVVDQLVDEVVQPFAAGIADVHAWPGANMGGVAQNVDMFRAIVVGGVRGGLGLGFQIVGSRDRLVIHG